MINEISDEIMKENNETSVILYFILAISISGLYALTQVIGRDTSTVTFFHILFIWFFIGVLFILINRGLRNQSDILNKNTIETVPTVREGYVSFTDVQLKGEERFQTDNIEAKYKGKTNNTSYVKSVILNNAREIKYDNQGKRGIVLVVDDEHAIRKVISDILKRENYLVLEAKDGLDCLNILKKRTVDIIILDIKMPHIDGVETMTLIHEKFKYLPIIIMSGHASVEVAISAVEKGAYDFLSKPLDFSRLLISIKNGVEKKQIINSLQVKQKDANILSTKIKIPSSLKTSFQQYLLYFRDYLKGVKGENVNYDVINCENGLEIQIEINDNVDVKKINYWFQEYYGYLYSNEEKIQILFENKKTSNEEKSILQLDLERQIEFLKMCIISVKKRNNLLKSENENLIKFLGKGLTDIPQLFEVEFYSKLRKKILSGELLNVIMELINKISSNNQYYNELIILKLQLESLVRESGLALIDKDERVKHETRITNSILGIIKKLEEEEEN